LLPALAASRRSARSLKCLANLRGIGVGMQLYYNETDLLPDVLPLTDPDGNENDPALLQVLADFVDVAVPRREIEGDPNSRWIANEPWVCPEDRASEDAASGFAALHESFGTSYDYVAGAVIFASEIFELFPGVPRSGIQKAVTRGLERRDWPLLVDADDWHPGRQPRNALYFPDMRAAERVEPSDRDVQVFFEEITPNITGLPGGG
jgi:hypothetical protein